MAPKTNDIASKEFYELCYRQYEYELNETDQLYQRLSFVLVILSLLGTIIYKLGRIDIFNQLFTRVDVFLYYVCIVSCLLCLVCSTTFAILFAIPRKRKYKTIASMNLWQKWLNDYHEYIEHIKKSDITNEKIGDALFHEITSKLAEAQSINAPINEKRRQYFYYSILIATTGFIAVFIQAFFYLLLKLQGI